MPPPYINNTRNLGDWEYQKFREDSEGKPAIAVVNPDGTNIGGGSSGGLTNAELRASPVPVTISGTPTTRWPGYARGRIDVDAEPMYFGYENATGSWYIRRLNFTTNTEMYFEGTGGISAAWAGRAGYTYVEFKDL